MTQVDNNDNKKKPITDLLVRNDLNVFRISNFLTTEQCENICNMMDDSFLDSKKIKCDCDSCVKYRSQLYIQNITKHEKNITNQNY